jgi:hypothetical protein
MPKLAPGLYDLLVDCALADALEEVDPTLREMVALGTDHAHEAITRAVQPRLFQALKSITGDDRLERQVALANRVLQLLEQLCSVHITCSPGYLCAPASAVPGCQGTAGCCTDFCDLAAAEPYCQGAVSGQSCVPLYQPGAAPEGFDDVGACMVP